MKNRGPLTTNMSAVAEEFIDRETQSEAVFRQREQAQVISAGKPVSAASRSRPKRRRLSPRRERPAPDALVDAVNRWARGSPREVDRQQLCRCCVLTAPRSGTSLLAGFASAASSEPASWLLHMKKNSRPTQY